MRRWLVLLVVALLVMPGTAMAQEATTTPTPGQWGEFEKLGARGMAMRTFESTASYTENAPLLIAYMIAIFEDDDAAEVGYTRFQQNTVREDDQLKETKFADLGDQSIAYRAYGGGELIKATDVRAIVQTGSVLVIGLCFGFGDVPFTFDDSLTGVVDLVEDHKGDLNATPALRMLPSLADMPDEMKIGTEAAVDSSDS